MSRSARVKEPLWARFIYPVPDGALGSFAGHLCSLSSVALTSYCLLLYLSTSVKSLSRNTLPTIVSLSS